MATNLTALELHGRSALLNVSELAAFLKVKPRTIYEMVAQNSDSLCIAPRFSLMSKKLP